MTGKNLAKVDREDIDRILEQMRVNWYYWLNDQVDDDPKSPGFTPRQLLIELTGLGNSTLDSAFKPDQARVPNMKTFLIFCRLFQQAPSAVFARILGAPPHADSSIDASEIFLSVVRDPQALKNVKLSKADAIALLQKIAGSVDVL